MLVGVRLFGITPYTVLSGSMEPEYKTGSIVYVEKTDTSLLKAGDCITFRQASGLVVTHRITEVVKNGTDIAFKTKGDANSVPDEGQVPALYVIGKPLFSVPYLGYVANFLQNPPGLYIVVGGTLILLLLSFLSPTNEEEKENKANEGN